MEWYFAPGLAPADLRGADERKSKSSARDSGFTKAFSLGDGSQARGPKPEGKRGRPRCLVRARWIFLPRIFIAEMKEGKNASLNVA